jgi:hypothetical protein
MKKIFQKTVVAVAVGTALTVISQSAMAASALLPAIKVGGGWVSVVSVITTTTATTNYVHATHQSKDITQTDAACTHLDGRSTLTPNDLTTTVLSTPGGAYGVVFPAADTVGGALINPAALTVPTSEGFLVLENYTGTGAAIARGTDGTLTADSIVFNLASGYMYSNRALSTTHLGASPAGTVTIDAAFTLTNTTTNNSGSAVSAPTVQATNSLPGNVGGAQNNFTALAFSNTALLGNLTRFGFLPPAAPANTGAYVIPVNRSTGMAGGYVGDATALNAHLAINQHPLSTNLVAAGYNARVVIEARMDAEQGYALGIYDRLEGSRSLSVTNPITCVGQLTPTQITGNAIPAFIANGGWFNLSARAMNTTGVAATGLNVGDGAVTFKTEWAAGYGLSFTPLNQQWYTK